MSKPSRSTKILRNILSQLFPAAFVPDGHPKRPLKIGIDLDIAAQFPEATKTEITKALRDYTARPSYKKALKDGALRIDLEGNECGTVTREEEDSARTVLQEWSNAKRAKSQQGASP